MSRISRLPADEPKYGTSILKDKTNRLNPHMNPPDNIRSITSGWAVSNNPLGVCPLHTCYAPPPPVTTLSLGTLWGALLHQQRSKPALRRRPFKVERRWSHGDLSNPFIGTTPPLRRRRLLMSRTGSGYSMAVAAQTSLSGRRRFLLSGGSRSIYCGSSTPRRSWEGVAVDRSPLVVRCRSRVDGDCTWRMKAVHSRFAARHRSRID